MLIKGCVIALLVFVLFNLFRALPAMLKGDNSVPMSRFLGRRVLFSAVIFVVLLIAIATGAIEPNSRPY